MNTSTAVIIRETALKHFAIKGFDATCPVEIAKEIGITCSMIRTYFTSKEEIYLAVTDFLGTYYTSFIEELITRTKGLALRDRIYEILMEVARQARNDRLPCLLWIQIIYFPPVTLKQEILHRMERTSEGISQKLSLLFTEGKTPERQEGVFLGSALYVVIKGMKTKVNNTEEEDKRQALFFSGVFSTQ
ncbi:TetR/AcrR family transcriptional regulator [Peribacillus sp. SCS-37]|uniref:TetR/AcrR family transcriptional regulator n=1 Tax=Paraperibacillus esterisolvens TaxID=3115296 RepID=UPI0039062F70